MAAVAAVVAGTGGNGGVLGGTIGLLDEAIDPLTNTMPDGMPRRRISAAKGGMDCITPWVKRELRGAVFAPAARCPSGRAA